MKTKTTRIFHLAELFQKLICEREKKYRSFVPFIYAFHSLVDFCMWRLGTEPKTWACATTRNRTRDLSVHRTMLNQLSHSGWASRIF